MRLSSKKNSIRFLLLYAVLLVTLDNAHTHEKTFDDVRIDTLTAHDLAGQLILTQLVTPELISRHRFGGVLLTGHHFSDPKGLKQRIGKLQQETDIGFFVAVDQEGGEVNRLGSINSFKKLPSAETLARVTPDEIYETIQETAKLLKTIGVNINLAPVLDPAENDRNQLSLLGRTGRSFGTGIDQIVPPAKTFTTGYNSEGILCVSKHFPGYDMSADSDVRVVKSDATIQLLEKMSESFRKLATLTVGVMMSNIVYRQFSQDPAVLSSNLVSMAREAHPHGLIMTDDLLATALLNSVHLKTQQTGISSQMPFLQIVRRALEAGNDVLLITDPKKAAIAQQAIAEWIVKEPAIFKQVKKSLLTILRIKQKLGLPIGNMSLAN